MRRLLCVLSMLSGCSHLQLRNGVVRMDGTSFRIGALPDTWQRVSRRDAVAFHNKEGGSILVGATCGRVEAVPLDVLTNHLLIGTEHRHERARTERVLDGRAALESEVDITLDGVPVSLMLTVTKKDNCAYDFELIADKNQIGARRADFEQLVAGFSKLDQL